MRIAAGLLASATLFFATGALGLMGTWALGTGVLLAVVAAITAVVAMEEREQLADDTPVEAAYLSQVDVAR